ncbi:class I SAM-dependent methyltransferase [Coleofasciculus sp. LEGE 07092]|uniref:class I SAM-dependent methyltransferase n=2 Tax=unclassified Coleofasciculus TaxID=2692782 RepID=UPI00188162D3|nr:class I SAM-dependent methyltransferase [Coleofasciculus sp. LEGE 07092]MBE9152481.1 class I SAM-dependent methyltransferase [Coleofasciculus sp. LEGE 07092]
MATVLRPLSYKYQWLYDGISQLAALAVGGEKRFHHLPLQGLTIHSESKVLDLCCGSGQATQYLVQYSQDVTGLDVSLVSLQRAEQNVPQAKYVEGFAEEMPFPENQFDVVHTSVALHEMPPSILRQILTEVYRVLKPGGVFALVDFHKPTNFLFWPGVALFLWLFETQTAWQLLETDLVGLLKETGFEVCEHRLYAGGSLQMIQVRK